MLRRIAAVCLLLCFLSAAAPSRAYESLRGDSSLRAHIRALCEAYNVPENLALAVIETESGWDADAVNGDGSCLGLMQIHRVNFPALERELGLTDPAQPRQNVEAGIWMLGGYIEKYLDYGMALMCYNCGEAGARRLWEEGCYTTFYSRRVLERMEELEWEALQEAREKRYLKTREGAAPML